MQRQVGPRRAAAVGLWLGAAAVRVADAEGEGESGGGTVRPSEGMSRYKASASGHVWSHTGAPR